MSIRSRTIFETSYYAGGGDDTAGINAALATIPPNRIGTVYLPSSVYRVGGTINIASGQRLAGMGFGASKIMAIGGQVNLFDLGVAQEAELVDFQITGNCTNAITFTGIVECMFRRLNIESVIDGAITNGINIVNGAGISYYVRIYDCKINQVAGSAITGTGSALATYLDIVNLDIGGNGVSAHGINTTNVGMKILNSDILQTTSDAVLAISSGSAGQVFQAINFAVDSCGGGFNIENYGSVMLADCWSSSNGADGGFITNCNNVTLTGNRFHYNAKNGLRVDTSTTIEVTGNHCVNNNTSNSTYSGIAFTSCTNMAVSGNLAREGALGPAGHQKYGISFDSGCHDAMVEGNELNGNVTANYFVDPAATGISIVNQTQTIASPGTALTTLTPANITTNPIVLTPGDWMIWGTAVFGGDATTSVTAFVVGLSATSATLPGPQDTNRADVGYSPSSTVYATATQVSVPVGPYFVTVTANTNYYFVGYSIFTVNTSSVWGTFYARRVA